MSKYKYKVTTEDDKSCVVSVVWRFGSKYDKYSIDYPDGAIVIALDNTLGIMVFNTKNAAVCFVKEELFSKTPLKISYKIKRVLPMSRGKTPKYIGYSTELDLFYMYRNHSPKRSWGMLPPNDTICYQKIRIVDTILTIKM